MKKRASALLLTLCLICSLFSVAALAAGAEDFSDVASDAWYYDYVDYVTTEGYFLGVGGGKFAPEETMTRAMFVTVLSRLAGAETDDSAAPFDDVAAGEWYSGAVAWASEQGIANGVGDNKFAPNDPVTRQDMCVFMDRFVTWYETANSVTHEEEAMVEAFGDADTIGSWATEAVESCRQYGLVNGYEDGNFYPLTYSTRAQVAAVIYRLSWLTNKSNSSGGGGGGSNGKTDTDTTTTYTITYDANGGAFDDGTTSFTASATTGSFTVTKIEPTYSGYVFVGWNAEADATGTSYAAGGEYTISSDLTLYAQWLSDKDYIGIAVAAAMKQFQNDYRDKLNGVDDTVSSALGSAVNISDSTLEIGNVSFSAGTTSDNSTNNCADNTRPQSVNADVILGANTVNSLVEYAVGVAYGLLNVDSNSAVSLSEVTSTVNTVIDTIENSYNVDISYDLNTMAKSIYSRVAAIGSNLWNNFYEENAYVTGDVTVSCGAAEAKITVTSSSTALDTTGTTRAALVRSLAAQIALDMYADLQSDDYSEYTSEVNMTATVTFQFTDSDAYGSATKNYPHYYPVALTLTLEDESGTVAYMYNNGEMYVRLTISEEMQRTYTDAMDTAVEKALSTNAISGEISSILNSTVTNLKKAEEFTTLTSTLNSLGVENSSTLVENALEQWKVDNPAKAIVLDYYYAESAEAGLAAMSGNRNNTAIYKLLYDVGEAAGESLYTMLDSLASTVASDMEDVDGLITVLNTPIVKSVLNIDVESFNTNGAMTRYVLAVLVDTFQSKVGGATSNASNAEADMQEEVDGFVTAKMNEELQSNNSINKNFELIDNLRALRYIFGVPAGVTVQTLVNIVGSDIFESYISNVSALDGVCKQLTSFFAKIPASASVTLTDPDNPTTTITIDSNALSDLADADTTSGFIKALSDLASSVDNLSSLSLDDFDNDGEGQIVTVKYGSYAPEFHFYIEIA